MQKNILNDLEKLIVVNEHIKAGIVPLTNRKHCVNKTLEKTDPVQARRLKRKFRKLWRKISAKVEKRNRGFCLPYKKGEKPSKTMKNARKLLVSDYLWDNAVKPVLEQIDKSIETKK